MYISSVAAIMTTYFEEMQSYIGFGPEDEVRLRALYDLLSPHFERLADGLLERLARHPGAEPIARLEPIFLEWLRSALVGPYDALYDERRARTSRRALASALPQEYAFAAMSILRLELRRLIEQQPGGEPGARRAAVDALDRLLDLELAVLMRSYQEDSEARLVQRERRVIDERLAAMQTLTAGLAHEVRNPLNAARLQLELLERRLRRSAADQTLLGPTAMAHQEIDRLSRLLHEFLEFARPTELAIGEHDVVAIVRGAVEQVQPIAAQLGVAVGISDSGPPVLAEVDAVKVHQILFNVLHNAIEAAGHGGHVGVEVRQPADEGAVRVVVRDSGPGIPDEIVERIFEPFFSTKQGGTGLGLAICHSLVGMHGGELLVRTSGGTEVEIRLPRRAAAAA
jgi:signal transduction histidine kinase